MPTRGRLVLVVSFLLCPMAAQAQPPAPLSPTLFAFPGGYANPASAASTGFALADRWLGDEPFSNPATPPRGEVTLSPSLIRVSRQDLRADNRNYDETSAFFDGAGLAAGFQSVHGVALWLYA